jgi:hypothetical protein
MLVVTFFLMERHMRRSVPLAAKLIIIFAFSSMSPAQVPELQPIRLPKPQMDGGKPLMQVLRDRKSARAFSGRKIPEQMLSNLIWRPAVSTVPTEDEPRLRPTTARRSTSTW